jgi:hypothetical protein
VRCLPLLVKAALITTLVVPWGAQLFWGESMGAGSDALVVNDTEKRPVAGELLVKFHQYVSEQRIEYVLDQVKGEVLGSIASIKLYRVRVPESRKVEEAIRVLQGFKEIEYVERNLLEKAPSPQ